MPVLISSFDLKFANGHFIVRKEDDYENHKQTRLRTGKTVHRFP